MGSLRTYLRAYPRRRLPSFMARHLPAFMRSMVLPAIYVSVSISTDLLLEELLDAVSEERSGVEGQRLLNVAVTHTCT